MRVTVSTSTLVWRPIVRLPNDADLSPTNAVFQNGNAGSNCPLLRLIRFSRWQMAAIPPRGLRCHTCQSDFPTALLPPHVRRNRRRHRRASILQADVVETVQRVTLDCATAPVDLKTTFAPARYFTFILSSFFYRCMCSCLCESRRCAREFF